MSADNYYIVRPAPPGPGETKGYGFYAIMGFMSVDEEPEIRPGHDAWFADELEAFHWAVRQDSEYGVIA